MRKLFGTDGIRGQTNTFPMTAEVALKLGMAAAQVFKEKGNGFKVVIGKDTRLSGYIFEYALTSGLCSMGADVYLMGPMPTPAVAHLTRSFRADCGIMITASHNPAEDNGIKFFDKDGYKLPDEVEERMEELVLENSFPLDKVGFKTGKAHKMLEVLGRYVSHAKKSVEGSLKGLKIVLDCANGAAYKVAPIIFSELGAEVFVYGNKPDGLNINQECGSQCPKLLIEKTVEHKADIGMAFDGDADRIIVVDERGEEVDGDEIMAIAAKEMIKNQKLNKKTLVATQYSNLGIDDCIEKLGGKVVKVLNGDRYVIEEMRKNRYNLGGEKTGHIIFSDYNTTGDGIISGLQIAKIMKNTGKKLSDLKSVLTKYPQVLLNIEVREKPELKTLPKAMDAIKSVEKKLGKDGRTLIRYSGTEMKCRVMIEGKSEKEIQQYAEEIANTIKNEIGE